MASSTSQESVQIRTADVSDADSISSILKTAFEEYQQLYTPEGFEATTPNADQVVSRLKEGPVWVASHETAIVATVSGVPYGDVFYIRGMGVSPETRRLGVARALLEHVESHAIQNRFKSLALCTTPFLLDAIRLYGRHGFRFVNEIPLDLFGTPLLKMIKRIS